MGGVTRMRRRDRRRPLVGDRLAPDDNSRVAGDQQALTRLWLVGLRQDGTRCNDGPGRNLAVDEDRTGEDQRSVADDHLADLPPMIGALRDDRMRGRVSRGRRSGSRCRSQWCRRRRRSVGS